jgi:Alkylmercury lyase
MSGHLLESRVHERLLRGAVESGRPPAPAEIALSLGVGEDDVRAALGRLEAEHGVVLHRGTGEPWIAHPFAFAPAPVWVEAVPPGAGPAGWWAPCLWCGLGVATLVARDVTLHARVGGEREPVTLGVKGGALEDDAILVHFSIPVARAWDEVVHWCQTVQPFRDERDVAAWCARHRIVPGVVVPIAEVHALARAWYGDHLSPAWRKHTVAEARAIFAGAGLAGEFWSLPDEDGRF